MLIRGTPQLWVYYCRRWKPRRKVTLFFQTTVHVTDLYSIKESDQNISWPNLTILADWGELKSREKNYFYDKNPHLYLYLWNSSTVGILLPWPEQTSDLKINYFLTQIHIHSQLCSSMELYNCEYTIAVAENPGEKWLGVCFFRATVQGCRALLFCRRRWSESQLAFC